MTDIKNQLAAYGLRLGIVEPLFLHATGQIKNLTLIQDELRSRKDFALADQLRDCIKTLQDARDYAFPGRPL